MQVHYSHKKPFLQIINIVECLSWICFITAGVLFLFYPPSVQAHKLVWPDHNGESEKLIIAIGFLFQALRFIGKALYKHKNYDWSLVYPQLGGFYLNEKSNQNFAKPLRKSITEELDEMLDRSLHFSSRIRELDNIGQEIMSLSKHIKDTESGSD